MITPALWTLHPLRRPTTEELAASLNVSNEVV